MRLLSSIGYGLATIVMYLGLSLVGWGLGDLAGYFSHAARVAYAIAIAAMGMVIAWQAYEDPAGFHGGRDEKTERLKRQTVVRFVMVAALYAALILLPFADRRGIAVLGTVSVFRWIGWGLIVLGLTAIVWSGLALGRMYSPEVTLQQGHQLVTSGPYRRIRHPRYLGVILLALGFALLYRSWAGLALCPPVIGAILLRIHDEEPVLQREFGADWDAYCRRSWRLLPWIY